MMYPKNPGKPTGMKASPKDMTSAKAKFAKMKENSPKKVTITAESMSPREMKKVNKSMTKMVKKK